ncbi:hypothetical protein [Nostoc linckia]|uniref:hypothetical protein n=1 Tax=Nostoc linckia TaxID=92942 RepID=UPI0015D4E2CE|nr:hypothetical protein [Nostoc linckia]
MGGASANPQGGRQGRQGRHGENLSLTSPQCPMPNAQCPMPNALNLLVDFSSQ